MQIRSIQPCSFKGRLYLNRNDLDNCKHLTYDYLKENAKGQVIESKRRDGFIWLRLEGEAEKEVLKRCKKENLLYYYLPGDIPYREFEKFAHSTTW